MDRKANVALDGAAAISTHWHAGYNQPGYLPESEPGTYTTFAEARDALTQEIDLHADNEASWADDHDCDDIPCPTYGDDCHLQRASSISLQREDLAVAAGPEWWGSADGLAYWVRPCRDPECEPPAMEEE